MQNRPSADALMMRAGYAVTGRPIGLWLGEEGVGARAVRGHSPVVTRRGGLPWPSWTTIAHTHEATMRSNRRRSEEHTSELQTLKRNSYAGVSCIQNKTQ